MGNNSSSYGRDKRRRHNFRYGNHDDDTTITSVDPYEKSTSNSHQKSSREFSRIRSREDESTAMMFIDAFCGSLLYGSRDKVRKKRRNYDDQSEDYSDGEETLDSNRNQRSRDHDRERRLFKDEDSTVGGDSIDTNRYSCSGTSENRNGEKNSDNGNSILSSGDINNPNASGVSIKPSSSMIKPLASSFAKRCYFTKAGIGKTTQHYEGLTLTGNTVLMLANAMKLKGCPTICDEDLRRVEQTYPNQFSRLPDELLLSSGWRRISKYCHFSFRPIPDGVPFYHSKKRIHPQTGGYYFLLALAVGMVRHYEVEPLTMDTLIVLQTDFPSQCDSAPKDLIHDPGMWTLVNKFCWFSGGPINTGEDVYYEANMEGENIFMLAFLSPSLTADQLYRLNESDDNMTLRTVAAVEEVERVYELTDRDFDDLKLYHLGPCRALPDHMLTPAAWKKILPRTFMDTRERALARAYKFEFEAQSNINSDGAGMAMGHIMGHFMNSVISNGGEQRKEKQQQKEDCNKYVGFVGNHAQSSRSDPDQDQKQETRWKNSSCSITPQVQEQQQHKLNDHHNKQKEIIQKYKYEDQSFSQSSREMEERKSKETSQHQYPIGIGRQRSFSPVSHQSSPFGIQQNPSTHPSLVPPRSNDMTQHGLNSQKCTLYDSNSNSNSLENDHSQYQMPPQQTNQAYIELKREVQEEGAFISPVRNDEQPIDEAIARVASEGGSTSVVSSHVFTGSRPDPVGTSLTDISKMDPLDQQVLINDEISRKPDPSPQQERDVKLHSISPRKSPSNPQEASQKISKIHKKCDINVTQLNKSPLMVTSFKVLKANSSSPIISRYLAGKSLQNSSDESVVSSSIVSVKSSDVYNKNSSLMKERSHSPSITPNNIVNRSYNIASFKGSSTPKSIKSEDVTSHVFFSRSQNVSPNNSIVNTDIDYIQQNITENLESLSDNDLDTRVENVHNNDDFSCGEKNSSLNSNVYLRTGPEWEHIRSTSCLDESVNLVYNPRIKQHFISRNDEYKYKKNRKQTHESHIQRWLNNNNGYNNEDCITSITVGPSYVDDVSWGNIDSSLKKDCLSQQRALVHKSYIDSTKRGIYEIHQDDTSVGASTLDSSIVGKSVSGNRSVTSEYSRSTAMIGAQKLLRKNREKRQVLMEKKRKELQDKLYTGDDKSYTKIDYCSVNKLSDGLLTGVLEKDISTSSAIKEGIRHINDKWKDDSDASSVQSGNSSTWSDNTNQNERSSRRLLILQMAKNRMKGSNKSSERSLNEESIFSVRNNSPVSKHIDRLITSKHKEGKDNYREEYYDTRELVSLDAISESNSSIGAGELD